MVIVNDLKPGMAFKEGDRLFSVINVDLNKTAMRKMVVMVKRRNLRTGVIDEEHYTGGDKIETIRIDKREVQYSYDDGIDLVFMDPADNYASFTIPRERLTAEIPYLKDNDNVVITSYSESEGKEEILGVILPDKVTLKVVDCEPAVKGNTATSASKNATLETGLQIKVPLFIKEGEMIQVSTATGEYAGRA